MQKIIPFLWFDTDAEEAAAFYAGAIPGSSAGPVTRYGKEGYETHHMPEGTAMTAVMSLAGFTMMGLNGGPAFRPNPSVSFHIRCADAAEVDAIWNRLSPGGKALMELGSYPFSDRYGWLEDRYGFSWQIILTPGPFSQKIVPALMYTGSNAGKAEEAVTFYASVFNGSPGKTAASSVSPITRHGKGTEYDQENSVAYAPFTLEGIEFGAMDSAYPHGFTFTEAVSLEISCADQAETDYFWNTLTQNGGRESACGWLYDKYGVSWQVTPVRLTELMANPKTAGNAMNAMLTMKKIDIATIESAVRAGKEQP